VLRAGKTAYESTTNGFWLGVDRDGVAKFNIGTGTWYLRWTGTRLEIAGKLTTGNGYVQIIDDATLLEEEGICLLQNAWASSGALRWQTADGLVGARITGNNNGTYGSDLLMCSYPRVTGAGRFATLSFAAYNKAYGEAGATVTGLSLSSSNDQCTTYAGFLCGGSRDQPQLVVTACGDGQTANLVEVYDSASNLALHVDDAGNLDLAGAVYVDGVKVLVNQGAAVANATGAGDVVAQLNTLLARLRVHGLIDT
jgi:hypothetical protein